MSTRVWSAKTTMTSANSWDFGPGDLVVARRSFGGGIKEVGVVVRVLNDITVAVRFWDTHHKVFEPRCTYQGPLSLVCIGKMVEE